VDGVQWNLDILDVIEALDFEQPFRHVLRRNTNPRNFGKADDRYFGRSLLSRPLLLPIRATAAADESVASMRRRFCPV
jgi:hypothetical protein